MSRSPFPFHVPLWMILLVIPIVAVLVIPPAATTECIRCERTEDDGDRESPLGEFESSLQRPSLRQGARRVSPARSLRRRDVENSLFQVPGRPVARPAIALPVPPPLRC